MGTKTFKSRVLAGFVLAAAVVLASAGPVGAAEEPTEQETCIIEAAEQGKEVKECIQSPNPILPETHELLWGTLSFLVLF
ncbi:MAG: hypothetical protein ACR2HV_01705, partial [Acidimicrobiales bacterium]